MVSIRNKRVLITGAAGSIGGELVRHLHRQNKIYGLDINESGLADLISDYKIWGRVGDIRNERTVSDIFSDFQPQIVFHAAAYKRVETMEYVPEEAIATNVNGTQNVLHYSKVYPVEKFVFISSDKAVNPTSIMGSTKALGEKLTKNSGKGYIVVRFGNVLGSQGSLTQIWQKQIDRGEPIAVTDSRMERYFMTPEQAINLVIKASKIGIGGEIICWEMGKKVNIYELAKKIISELGQGEIKIIGIRPGETLTEEIMTEEERKRAIKKGEFWIIK